MGIGIDTIDSSLLSRLATPPVGIADEEKLFLRKVVQTWKVFVWSFCLTLLPCCKRGSDTTCVGNILSQCETTVDMDGVAIWAFNGIVMVLIDETVCFLLECFHGTVGPPIRVVSILIVMPARGVKGV